MRERKQGKPRDGNKTVVPTPAPPEKYIDGDRREGGTWGSRVMAKKQAFPRLQHPENILMDIGARTEAGEAAGTGFSRQHLPSIRETPEK